jgi:hypothetical protein
VRPHHPSAGGGKIKVSWIVTSVLRDGELLAEGREIRVRGNAIRPSSAIASQPPPDKTEGCDWLNSKPTGEHTPWSQKLFLTCKEKDGRRLKSIPLE